MTNVLTVYINQHEFFIVSFFEFFVTCNAIKNVWLANVKSFSGRNRKHIYFIESETETVEVLLAISEVLQVTS